jgi:hypothetical protein
MALTGDNASSCDGACSTFAELEAISIAGIMDGPYPYLAHMPKGTWELAFARLIARGVFEPCPVHPDHFRPCAGDGDDHEGGSLV